jgi:hypothetical protein
MSREEQFKLKKEYYGQAIRQMDTAKELLKNAKREGGNYRDPKKVKMACKTAFSSVLVALDCFLILKGVDKPKGKVQKPMQYYERTLAGIDRKMSDHLICAYQILYVMGYCDGFDSVAIIKTGWKYANAIINRIKPKVVQKDTDTVEI